MKELHMKELQCDVCHQYDLWFDYGQQSTLEEPEIPPIVYCRECGDERPAEDADIEYIKEEYEMDELPDDYSFIREMEDIPYQTFFKNIIKILNVGQDEVTLSEIQDVLEETISKLESENEQILWDLGDARDDINSLSEEVDDLGWEVDSLNETIEQMEKVHADEIADLEDELNELKDKYEDMWS